MKQKVSYSLVMVILFSVIVSVCAKPNSPLEVTEQFWTTVKKNDLDRLDRYITNKNTPLVNITDDWSRVIMTFKEIRIVGNNAQVETIFENVGPNKNGLTFFSMLILVDGQWKIDFDNTMKNVTKENSKLSIQKIFNSIKGLGGDLAGQMQESIDELKQKRPTLEKELETLGDDVKNEINALIKKYGPELKKNLHKFSDELDEILNKALKNKEKQDNKKPEPTLI